MDGLLTVAESGALADHLAGCARCRSVARAYQESREQLAALRPTVPPRDMGARIFAALDREMTGVQRRIRLPDGLARPGVAFIGSVAAGSAAVIVLVVGARLLLAPSVAPMSPSGTAGALAAVAPDATPFSVPAAELALVEQGIDGLTVYQTAVSVVCPPTAVDCATADPVALSVVGIARDLMPRGVTMDPQGHRMALLAEDTLGADTVSVMVMPPMDGALPRGAGPGPDGRWPEAGSAGASDDALATLAPLPSGPADPPVQVVAVLQGVEAVGAAPAWSPDGTMLAFSAMPIDRSRGPDIYLWQPGQDRARRVTADHASWFASWSGSRIVVSRLARGEGREAAETVLMDPTGDPEEVVRLANAWLPAVDPSGRFAVAWRGTLTGGNAQVRPRSGGLALIDWQLVDPGAASVIEAEPIAMLGVSAPRHDAGPARAAAKGMSPWLESIESGTRDTPAALDWQVRWASSGTTFGYWVADARGASWGRLTVLRVLPETRRIDRDETLLGPTLARRSFSLGEERIAWVAPAQEGADGELRVRTWGDPGQGTLRIRDFRLRDGIPAF